ncbi:class I adenylate-forming enzyme family protein [Halopseudomonas maritima]|uniref:class I adenylate-forming enzyme family protein n=1 Tax=Halopseudomonas maritima TaxID=2918528 RepID=UPI001EEB0FE4|nr:class I adenylate-forming enzyme family protein [Halopseudomonas maritima]UJJ31574.1 acyl--CoA ligase [Halopseudomonas maritima]
MSTQHAFVERARASIGQLLHDQSPFAIDIDAKGVKSFRNAPANLVEAIQAGRQHGAAPFLLWQEQRYSFDSFFAAADQLTAVFQHELKLQPGERVAIAMRNRPEWMITFVAAVQAGLIPVPLNSWGLREELLYGVKDCGAVMLVCDLQRWQQVNGGLPVDTKVLLVDSQGDEPEAMQWTDVMAQQYAPMQLHQPAPDDDALILYTSGTTSRAKGVVSTHRALGQALFALDYQGAMAAMTSPDRIKPILSSGLQPTALLCFPLFHVSGLHAQFLSMLRNGRRMVIMYKWDVEQALRLIEQEGCTQFSGAPVMMQELLAHPGFDSSATASLFSLGLGGGAASSALLDRILTIKPHAMAGTGYGMTEGNGIGAAHAGDQFVLFPASAGWPLPIVDMVVGERPDQPAAAGEQGPIWLRSPALMRGYWNRPLDTRESLLDGWLFSGDVGRLDQYGMISITDRIKDIIIRGGENISALEVEQVAASHPAVVEAAAFACPDARFGETVGLAVYCREALDSEQLRGFMAEQLAAYKVPEQIWFSPEPLARNATGKLQKPQIKLALGV